MKNALVFSILILSTLIPLVVLTPNITTNSIGFQDDMPHARVLIIEIVDGVTARITPPVYVQGDYRSLIKLADISPTNVTKNALKQLLDQYGYIVLLDLDKNTIDDGKAIAVMYVRLNNTHILNVNKWLVENGLASVNDKPNIFDPSKWIMHFIYPVENERTPTITKVVLCENCNIANSTTWGVNVETSINRNYLAIAYTLVEDKKLRIFVLDYDGSIIRNDIIDNSTVHIGYSDLAVNDTGFFVTWRDEVLGPHRARCAFIPYDPTLPINVSDRVFTGGGSWHSPPITAWNPLNNTWIVVYGHQTMAYRPRYFINFVNKEGLPAGGTTAIWLSPFTGTNRTGLDINGRLIYDAITKKFAFISRNESTPGEFNVEVLIFPATKDGGVLLAEDVFRLYIDDREGPQGPEAIMFNGTFTYFMLYPTIYTTLLGDGRYLLTVYNDTTISLAYAIINLEPPAILLRDMLISYDEEIVFSPGITANSTHWLVTWSAGGWINGSIITYTSPYIRTRYTVVDKYGGRVRTTYDPASWLFTISYTMINEAGFEDTYITLYNSINDRLEPWILPVATKQEISEIPLYTLVLKTEDSAWNIAIVALEGNNLVVYIVDKSYPGLINPVKGAIPVLTPTPTPTETIQTVTVTTTTTITLVTTTTQTLTTTQAIPITLVETTTIRTTNTFTTTEFTTVTEQFTERITETRTQRETIINTKTFTSITTVTERATDYGTVLVSTGVVLIILSILLYVLMRRKR